jgi:hypothetical protein
MAGTIKPTVLPGTALLILIGDGASPEVFAQPCGLTSNKVSIKAATNSTVVPWCDAPAAAAWESKDVNSLSMSASGSGVMAKESFDIWNDWALSGEPKNAQIKIDDNKGNYLGYYSGTFVLSSFDLTGTRGEKITVDVSLDNDDIVVWVPAP